MHHAHITAISGDLFFLAVGSVVMCVGAAYLLRAFDD
jgi:hypothetical protein